MKLFLAPSVKQLRLYDCSKLDSESLQLIPAYCPHAELINLQFCGQLDNDAIDKWASTLSETLRAVELYGPYLVRKECWHRFFEKSAGTLRSFKIRETPRFDLSCAETLVKHCPNITELGLAQIGPLDGPALKPLHAYKELTYLDISDPGVSAPGVPPKSLQDEDVISLLEQVGGQLEHLNLSGNADLTDAVLSKGIRPHCPNVRVLRLAKLGELTGDGVENFFSEWKSGEQGPTTAPALARGLVELDVQRVLHLHDAALRAIVGHSGKTLQHLNLNSDDALTESGLHKSLNEDTTPNLRFLDVSFVRKVDDEVMQKVMAISTLRKVHVFGCNRVSLAVKSTPALRVVGKERY